MLDRESRLPLVLGAVVALLLHTAMVPVWGWGLYNIPDRSDWTPPVEDKPNTTPQEAELGKAHASITNIAWISYDDYQELLARLSVVEQPALQRQQDPVPNAPIELDPTPPAPDSPTPSESKQPGEDSNELDTTTVPISPVGPVPLPSPEEEGQIPYTPDGPMPSDTEAVVEDYITQPQQITDNSSEDIPEKPGESDTPTKPTSAPRDAGEVQPVTIIPGIVQVKPGAVLTADGIEIKTVIPRPSVIAIYSTVPKNPEAVLWFNKEGRVIKVDLTRSTGADNWDDPVRSALERWTATGERIEELEGELKLTVELLLTSHD